MTNKHKNTLGDAYLNATLDFLAEEYAKNPRDILEISPKNLSMLLTPRIFELPKNSEGFQYEKLLKSGAYILGRKIKNTSEIFMAKYPGGRAVYIANTKKVFELKTKRENEGLKNPTPTPKIQ